MNNIISLPESPKGVHGDPSGPMDYMFVTIINVFDCRLPGVIQASMGSNIKQEFHD